MSAFARPFALLGTLATSFGRARRYEHLFSLSDAELTRRGLSRDDLVRGYISGFAHG